jgi:hypothetical protein
LSIFINVHSQAYHISKKDFFNEPTWKTGSLLMMCVDVRCKIPQHVTKLSFCTEFIILSILFIHLPNTARPNFQLANIDLTQFPWTDRPQKAGKSVQHDT